MKETILKYANHSKEWSSFPSLLHPYIGCLQLLIRGLQNIPFTQLKVYDKSWLPEIHHIPLVNVAFSVHGLNNFGKHMNCKLHVGLVWVSI